jgi:RNA polymerase sigma factor (sigma-70 family)
MHGRSGPYLVRAVLPAARSDAQLLLAARSDPQAFREIYERYAVWMRSWFHRQTGSETAALDLTAETFAQAWRGVRRFKDMAGGSAAPWLFGIARNLLRQYHKHNRIETAARARLGMPIDWEGTEAYDAVDERIHAQGMRPALRDAVGALPQEQRLALELRVVEQLGYDEISERLGCSINAARLRVSRALRALTADLGGAR